MCSLYGRFFRLKYTVLWLVIASAIGAYYVRGKKTILPEKIVCTVCGPLSEHGHELVKNYIAQQQSEGTCLSLVVANLKQTFNWINTVSVALDANKCDLTISTHVPLAYCNNSLLLTAGGELFDHTIFTQESFASIPQITIAQSEISNSKALQKIAALVPTIPHELFNFYNVTWNNMYTIILQDRSINNFKIISASNVMLNNNILASCLRIKQGLQSKGCFKNFTHWKADLRFSNHIIVAKEGRNYVSSIS